MPARDTVNVTLRSLKLGRCGPNFGRRTINLSAVDSSLNHVFTADGFFVFSGGDTGDGDTTPYGAIVSGGSVTGTPGE